MKKKNNYTSIPVVSNGNKTEAIALKHAWTAKYIKGPKISYD